MRRKWGCTLSNAWEWNIGRVAVSFVWGLSLLNRFGFQIFTVLSCQAFDLEWGWRWPCCDRDQYLVSIITRKFAFEKQQDLYHNKVTLSLTPIKRLGNQPRNCKMDYCFHEKRSFSLVQVSYLLYSRSQFSLLIFNYHSLHNSFRAQLFILGLVHHPWVSVTRLQQYVAYLRAVHMEEFLIIYSP